MKRKTVFDSKSESLVFQKLVSQWQEHFTIYPSLPFSKVISADLNALTKGEQDFYYKTNVDFTVCSHEGEPLLCIEFDGLGGGFSLNGEYQAVRPTVDQYRKLKLDFKLKLAEQAGFPLIVVSYDETATVDKEEALTVLDGVIGQFFKGRIFPKMLQDHINVLQNELDQIPEHMQSEYIQDIAIGIEVEAEMMADPIVRKTAHYMQKCHELGGIGRMSFEFLDDPSVPQVKTFPPSAKQLKSRVEALNKAPKTGARVTIECGKITVVRSVWIRNINSIGFSVLSIVENIAEFLAYKGAFEILSKPGID